MLQAAHTQLRQGVKVIAGVVETHGRAETEALLGGLPQQPLVRSEYRGVMLEEMDLDGLLAAKPKLVLVDELAHSNAPGSRHAKRWQDIQELLAAGIDVYTTVNVQHLESLNDQVRGITGVQVRETLPDWVLQEAYELLLIDLPPRELLERLREGKVYVPEQARAAIDAFFTQTNLTALRELAMQTAAAQVDNDLAQGYRQLGQAAPAVRGRLLVGVDGDAQAERLVRHASRVAQRRHLPWSLVHVDNGTVRDEQSRLRLQNAQQLAERLGGEVVLLRAGEVAKTLIQHAAERRASLVLVGQSRPSCAVVCSVVGSPRACCARPTAWKSTSSIATMNTRSASAGARRWSGSTICWRWWPRCWPVPGVGGVQCLPLPNISLVFLAAVLLVAVRSSLGPALACAALSFLTYDFLFIPPNFPSPSSAKKTC
jgi:two-component system sensor histidine kinase KdpD